MNGDSLATFTGERAQDTAVFASSLQNVELAPAPERTMLYTTRSSHLCSVQKRHRRRVGMDSVGVCVEDRCSLH